MYLDCLFTYLFLLGTRFGWFLLGAHGNPHHHRCYFGCFARQIDGDSWFLPGGFCSSTRFLFVLGTRFGGLFLENAPRPISRAHASLMDLGHR